MSPTINSYPQACRTHSCMSSRLQDPPGTRTWNCPSACRTHSCLSGCRTDSCSPPFAAPGIFLQTAGPTAVSQAAWENSCPAACRTHNCLQGPRAFLQPAGPAAVLQAAGPTTVLLLAGPTTICQPSAPRAVLQPGGLTTVLKLKDQAEEAQRLFPTFQDL